MKKVLKIIGIVFGCIIAFVLLILLFLGPIAKVVVQKYDEQIVGRQVEMSKLKINVLRGNARIYDFSIKETDETTDFVTFDTLDVSIRLLKLLKSEVNIPHITLAGPDIRITQHDTVFNFTDIIEHFRKDTTSQTRKSSQSWAVSLQHTDIINGSIEYLDVVRDDSWGINDINITIPGLYFGADRQSEAGIQFAVRQGGTVGITADYTMATNEFSVGVRLDSVATEVGMPFLESMLNVHQIGGTVSANVHADGNLNRPSDTRLSGWVSAENIDVQDSEEQSVMAFDKLYVALGNINLETLHLDLDTVILTNLHARYVVDKDSVNTLTRLLAVTDKQPEVDTSAVVTSDKGSAELAVSTHADNRELYLTLRLLDIQNASASYEDHTMHPLFRYQVKDLGLKGFDLSNHTHNHIKLSARVGKHGRLEGHYKGDLDILNGKESLELLLNKMDVAEFSPFTEKLMAYPLEGGELSMHSLTHLNHSQINSHNRVEIQDMEVGKKIRPSDAPYKAIPLKLGVGLLRSSKGLIVLELPVTGDLKNPKFSFKQIILRAVGKIFLGPLMGIAEKQELTEMMDILHDPELHAQLQHGLDSIAVADSIARMDSIAHMDSIAQTESLVVADSLATVQ